MCKPGETRQSLSVCMLALGQKPLTMSVNAEEGQSPMSGDKRQAVEKGQGSHEKKARVDQTDEVVNEENDWQPTEPNSSATPSLSQMKTEKLPLFQRTPT
eukprot:118695-Hanusia_phi.AAC.6